MEKKDRKIYFALNVAAIFLIIAVVYLNYQLITYIGKTHSGLWLRSAYGLSPMSVSFIAYFISAFLCSLMLQGEEIFIIHRRRKSLLIRWELIILGIIALLLALIEIWLPLVISLTGILVSHSLESFLSIIYSSYLWEVVFMFAAGMFFIRAFYVRESLMEKKDRIISFIFNIVPIFLIVLIVYCNHEFRWYLIETSYITKQVQGIDSSYTNQIIVYFVEIISAFVCSLLLMGENIYAIIHQRKALIIRREMLILGIVVTMLALMRVWLVLIINIAILGSVAPSSFYIPGEIIKMISFPPLWENVFMFAATMFFVRAFHIKFDQIDLRDGEPIDNHRS